MSSVFKNKNKVQLKELSTSGETVLTYYESNQKMFESQWSQGKLFGKTQSWYIDGAACFECEFLNGLPHGPWKSWHQNGQLHLMCEFHLGEKRGSWKKWDESGKIIFDEPYFSIKSLEEALRIQQLKVQQTPNLWKLVLATLFVPFMAAISITLLQSSPIRGWGNYGDSLLLYLKNFPFLKTEGLAYSILWGGFVEIFILLINLILILYWMIVLIRMFVLKSALRSFAQNVIQSLNRWGDEYE